MSTEDKLNKLISLLKENVILPGGIRTKSSVCGKANCRCKDKENPKLHGPYNILSYSLSEKSSTMSLSPDEAPAAKKMIECFKEAKSLLNQIAIDYAEEARGGNTLEVKPPEIYINKVDKKIATDKKKSVKQSERNEKNRIKIKNLEQSKNTWKKNCKTMKEKLSTVTVENKAKDKQIKQQKEEIHLLKIELEDSKKNRSRDAKAS